MKAHKALAEVALFSKNPGTSWQAQEVTSDDEFNEMNADENNTSWLGDDAYRMALLFYAFYFAGKNNCRVINL